jgi:hypothetical protein
MLYWLKFKLMKIGLKVIIQDATVEDLNQAALQKQRII